MAHVSDSEMKVFEVVYPQASEMIRHFDRIRFASWTVYTAIVAAAFFAEQSARRITDTQMIAIIWVASLFFVLFISRVQRNYKVFFGTVIALELRMYGATAWDDSYILDLGEAATLVPGESSASLLPFVGTTRFTSPRFWRYGSWDKYLGAVPYFPLIISFFILVPTIITIVYMFT